MDWDIDPVVEASIRESDIRNPLLPVWFEVLFFRMRERERNFFPPYPNPLFLTGIRSHSTTRRLLYVGDAKTIISQHVAISTKDCSTESHPNDPDEFTTIREFDYPLAVNPTTAYYHLPTFTIFR